MTANSVRFVMIGGFAYHLYRNPRATGDIGFIVSTDMTNQKKLRSVLMDFGFGSVLPPAEQSLIDNDKVLMLGRAPFRNDILAQIDGVSFQEIESTCEVALIDEISVPVISARLLLKNKRSTGRLKDLADAESLEKWLFPDGHHDFESHLSLQHRKFSN